ncbi:MAG: tripartite tricarboxylate transporter substrate binding protein [Xanthomonadaceae bacterium]|nr:tripartite tricarboxylate transporter substrate binding protein [Xanthomonadaceae bacterium]
MNLAAFSRRTLLTSAALAATVAGACLPAHAQEWPTKSVRLITPYPVGGGPDGIARLLADKLSKKWGKPVVVDNRPGGNGFIAIDAFKRGASDGHDLLQLDSVHLTAYPYMFKKLPYDVSKDFEPIAPLFQSFLFFVVPTNSKYTKVSELIADAKARPGKINYGSWSIGNPVHLGVEELQELAGIKVQHVIYKETTQLYTSVGTGELDFSIGSAGTAGAMYRAGKLRFLAVAGPKRMEAYPDVPTVAESGGPANGYEVSGWNTIAGPKGLSPAIQDKIRKDIAEALSGPDVKEKFLTFGYVPLNLDRPQFAKFIQNEASRYSAVIKRAKIELE